MSNIVRGNRRADVGLDYARTVPNVNNRRQSKSSSAIASTWVPPSNASRPKICVRTASSSVSIPAYGSNPQPVGQSRLLRGTTATTIRVWTNGVGTFSLWTPARIVENRRSLDEENNVRIRFEELRFEIKIDRSNFDVLVFNYETVRNTNPDIDLSEKPYGKFALRVDHTAA